MPILRTDRLVKLKLTGIADSHDNSTFIRIAFLCKGHITCDTFKFFDLSECVPNSLAVFFQITGNRSVRFNSFLNKAYGIPG